MATIKITDLPNLLSGSATGSDVIPIVDVSADITKKITIDQLSGLVGGGGSGAGIPTGIDNCVEATQLLSTCTQAIVGGRDNLIDTFGYVCSYAIYEGFNFQTRVELISGSYVTSSGYDFIGAGVNNIITGSFGCIGEGWLNGPNTIVGGTTNLILSQETECIYDRAGANTIGGGMMNIIAMPSGSGTNSAYQPFANTISGGYSNWIKHSTTSAYYLASHTISGGYLNIICGETPYWGGNVIGGGYENVMLGGETNTIAGGANNRICQCYSCSGYYGGGNFIGGGYSNVISSALGANLGPYESYSNVISGGQINCIGQGHCNFIGGGGFNNIVTVSALSCSNSIVGGWGNRICVSGSNDLGCNIIGGGWRNYIHCVSHSSIIGGCCNIVNHACSHIVGNNITTRTTSSLHVNNLLLETGSIPTSDPGIPGMLYIADGALKVSGCL